MTLHFEVTGHSPPTIVFTHGLAASGETWRAQVEELSARYRTVVWDLRGHGRSDAPDEPCSLEKLAGDLRGVLDASRTERAVVVGHSAGGVVAMQLALQDPVRVAGLVLVGTASECNQRAFEFYEGLARTAEERGMASVHRRLGLGADYAGPAAEPATFAAVARCMGGLHHRPLTPRLGEIRCPTLIVVGDKDFLGAGGSVILNRGIAGSELHIVPERGHGIFLEDPAAFNGLLDDFLRRKFAREPVRP